MGSQLQIMLGGAVRNICREGRVLIPASASSLNSAFLSTTSSSEAQEALQHVERLDRMKDMDRMVESYLEKNLTLIAYDRGTGRPVGAAVNNSCHKDELSLSLQQELKDVGDASYHPIQAIHHQLRHENEHIFEEIGTNKMFSIKMIGIGEEDRGQGVATNLIRRSILLAGCLGFRAIKTEATGRFSKETFQRVGMQPAASIKYDDFVFEGKKPFAGMKDGNSEITFMKKKFFQSSLRHIL